MPDNPALTLTRAADRLRAEPGPAYAAALADLLDAAAAEMEPDDELLPHAVATARAVLGTDR